MILYKLGQRKLKGLEGVGIRVWRVLIQFYEAKHGRIADSHLETAAQWTKGHCVLDHISVVMFMIPPLVQREGSTATQKRSLDFPKFDQFTDIFFSSISGKVKDGSACF